jgi:flagellar protein FlaG
MPIAPIPDTPATLAGAPGFPAVASTPAEPVAVPPPQAAVGTGLHNGKERAPHENVNRQPLDQAIETLNARLTAWSTNLRFSIDEDTQQVVVELLDTGTGDVIRQIPTEEALHIARSIGNLQGLGLQTRA